MGDVRPDAFSDREIMSTAYALIGITSAFALARIAISFVTPRHLTLEDALVFFAYVENLAMCSLYISLAPGAQRLSNVKLGNATLYPTLQGDVRYISRRYFVAPLLFWMLLWSIKFSFLMLYRKLLQGISKIYTYIWWFIVVVCIAVSATQTGNFAAYLTACSDLYLFVNGGCKDMTTARQLISLLYSYAADTLTNIMIMALPTRLVWNLQMSRSKKFGVIGVFAIGAVCVVMAAVRVARITKNVYQYNMGIDGTWLAIWGMVECSIAVIVGFVPSFAVLFRVARHKTSSYNPYSYQKQRERRSGGRPEYVLNIISSRTSRNRRNMGLETTDSMWVDDADSQRGFALGSKFDGITVTTIVQQ
ncbi:hypothetical protein BU23DRAFT_448510 [Bimuria novae-zelandiae CBS 107.79]|uniref:Rhodopsin domain-containing protein n=1 Tax=Bimuria novae-zelandiae CBS 107.79 TaxID=1447943 RepID=A0A6A5VVA5_9PLEO|nr:hypothetical protein BU23DRAFT_448510 [Bimuria novae-zelandiae CBS 107.79]